MIYFLNTCEICRILDFRKRDKKNIFSFPRRKSSEIRWKIQRLKNISTQAKNTRHSVFEIELPSLQITRCHAVSIHRQSLWGQLLQCVSKNASEKFAKCHPLARGIPPRRWRVGVNLLIYISHVARASTAKLHQLHTTDGNIITSVTHMYKVGQRIISASLSLHPFLSLSLSKTLGRVESDTTLLSPEAPGTMETRQTIITSGGKQRYISPPRAHVAKRYIYGPVGVIELRNFYFRNFSRFTAPACGRQPPSTTITFLSAAHDSIHPLRHRSLGRGSPHPPLNRGALYLW